MWQGGEGTGEWARHWRYPRLPGTDLLRARYVGHAFPRHTHASYVLGAVTSGVEQVGLPAGGEHVTSGNIIMINPETPHTARAGTPEGWTYATLYPSAELVADLAAELTTLRGTLGFTRPVAPDPQAVRLITEIHRAAEQNDALAADSLLRTVLARVLHQYAGALPVRRPRDAGARTAERARGVLEERMLAPPTLKELAVDLGTTPFVLLRAFRSRYGMPPHAWLTDARVRRARRLLDTGTRPASAAAAVGFADQPHLNRHFTRIVGVPPGSYQRERAGMYKTHGQHPA